MMNVQGMCVAAIGVTYLILDASLGNGSKAKGVVANVTLHACKVGLGKARLGSEHTPLQVSGAL